MKDFDTPERLDPEKERPFFIAPEPVPPRRAGYSSRAVAYLMDIVLVEFIFLLFLVLRGVALDLAAQGGADPMHPDEVIIWMPLWAVLYTLYFAFFTFWGGRTPGKMVMRIRVVTTDFEEVSAPRALIRSLAYFLSWLFFGAGFLLAAVTPSRRALHDYLAGTCVVVERS